MVLTTNDLAKRWKLTPRSIVRIPEDKLPRMNVSTGTGRPTFRFRMEDILKFEKMQTIGKINEWLVESS